jgi:hypothetical protein
MPNDLEARIREALSQLIHNRIEPTSECDETCPDERLALWLAPQPRMGSGASHGCRLHLHAQGGAVSKGDFRRPSRVGADEYAINFALAMGPDKCKDADTYQAQQFPRCNPICRACAQKWRDA